MTVIPAVVPETVSPTLSFAVPVNVNVHPSSEVDGVKVNEDEVPRPVGARHAPLVTVEVQE